MKRLILLALALVCVLVLAGCQNRADAPKEMEADLEYDEAYAPTETPDHPNSWALAAHFYLDGKGYFHHGKLTYELPEGYEFIADVINVGDTFSGSGEDFEGNVDGKIYMNQTVSDTAYFSWAEWNEEADGPAPFLKLELKTTE